MTISETQVEKSVKTDAERSLKFRNRKRFDLESLPRTCRVWKFDPDGVLIGTARGNDGWRILGPYRLFRQEIRNAPPWLRTHKQRADYNRRMIAALGRKPWKPDTPADISEADQFRFQGDIKAQIFDALDRMAPEIIPDKIYHEPTERVRIARDERHIGPRCLVNPPIRKPVRRTVGGIIEPRSQYRANTHEFLDPPLTSQPMYRQVVLTRDEMGELGIEWLSKPALSETLKPVRLDNKPLYKVVDGEWISLKRPYADRKPQEPVRQSEIDGWTERAQELSRELNYRCPPMYGFCCASASGRKVQRKASIPPREMKMAA